jgi:hypothetical protein
MCNDITWQPQASEPSREDGWLQDTAVSRIRKTHTAHTTYLCYV